MIEYEDVAERRAALAQMIGIEHRVWVRIGDHAPLFALANEDLPRSNDEKTAAVHFLRFDIPPAQIVSAKSGAPIAIGIDHPRFAISRRSDSRTGTREPGRRPRLNRVMGGLGQRIARYIAAPAKYYKPTVVSGGEVRWPEFIQPCDVLLVEGSSRISTAIKYLTQSTWSHSAICVGGAAPFPLVEADVEFGVASVPYEKYVDANVRICRPVGLSDEDRARVIDFVVAHIGNTYDLKNVFDLARFLLPTPPIPPRWRRQLLTFGSGEPTKAICSSLIAEAFEAVRYPILPDLESQAGRFEHPLGVQGAVATAYTPRDFDLSPYFAVIKPTIERRFDYREFPWLEHA